MADVVEIKSEAVDGFHAEGGVLTIVVSCFDPSGERVVELLQIADVAEIAHKELIAHGAEEAFDFSFGSTVAHGCVDENDAESCTDETELFRAVVRAIIDIDGFWDTSLVERGLEAIKEVGGVVGRVKATMGDDARCVINEADEEGFDGCITRAD